MGIRKNLNEVRSHNAERAAGRIFLRELYLTENNDETKFAVLKGPISADYHNLYDNATRKRSSAPCTKTDDKECDWCSQDVPVSDMMMMWVWVYDIMHTKQNPDASWDPVKGGNRSYFKEDVNTLRLLKRPMANWNDFEDIIVDLGSLKNKKLKMKRRGRKGDQRTYYNVSVLENIKLNKVQNRLVRVLPKLSDVVKGNVDSDKINKILKSVGAREWVFNRKD